MNTEAGNKLIAEFMGVKIGQDKFSWRIGVSEPLQEKHLAYHNQWGWLMPVIEKMAKMKIKYLNTDEEYSPYPTTFGMVDGEGNYMARIYCSQLFYAKTLIEAAWLAIVDFIEWYNSEKGVQVSGTSKASNSSNAGSIKS